MTFLFDTSVYLRILLDAQFARRAEPALRRVAPRLFLSSVVRAELTQGARGPEGRALVDRLAGQLERVGRVVTPSHDDWVHAATVQSRLWDSSPGLRTKRLLHDVLLAIGAQRIGARIVTDNERDFVAIGRWVGTRRLSSGALLPPGDG
jgi:predicted nucleic acid-binding protein